MANAMLAGLGASLANSAASASQGSGASHNKAQSGSSSFTNGTGATMSSNVQAALANTTAYDAWREAAEYNAEQARIQREWQEHMANTQYQRAVKDMKAAGLNPVLAAMNGIGGASIGSGATASMSSPDVFMGHSYADTNSASWARSLGEAWNNSQSGLATALMTMGDFLNNALDALVSSGKVQQASDNMNYAFKEMTKSNDRNSNASKSTSNALEKIKDSITKSIYGSMGTTGGPYNGGH